MGDDGANAAGPSARFLRHHLGRAFPVDFQHQKAHALNIAPSTLSKVLTGRRPAGAAVLASMATAVRSALPGIDDTDFKVAYRYLREVERGLRPHRDRPPELAKPFLGPGDGGATPPTHDDASARPPVAAPDPELPAAVRRVAEAARTTLQPDVLPPLARRSLRATILEPIAVGLTADAPRIVALVGPAGFGKTVLLGQLYDELPAIGAEWTAIVRGGEVQRVLDAPDRLAVACGLVASGIARSIVELAEEMGRAHGRGAVLVDTLDAVLTPALVPALRDVFEGLVATGTTVVFTCREHEYEVLEPLSHSFPGLAPRMHRRTVPLFDYPDEVERAALGFLADHPAIDARDGRGFVDGLLALAADSVPLKEITQNPLLLALLCDLFGEQGFVPPDLTASRLWERYWFDRVARVRKAGPSSPVGRVKQRLALAVARGLFALSTETLCLSMYEHDVELPAEAGTADEAWRDLLSEGVIKREEPSGRVGFFHQTLLEYAIARHLTGARGEDDLEAVFERAARAGNGARGLQLWPVIRQVLAIADDGACARWLERLDRRALPAFRAAALALTSREQADLLARVREWALAPGPDVGAEQRAQLQREWLRALEGAVPSLAPAAFEGALAVLARGESEAATLATETAARLIRRFGDRLPERRVVDAVETIGRASSSAARHNSLMGKLLGTFAAAARPLDRVDLAALRDSYAGLPSGLRPRVIELHLAAEVGGVDAVGLGELSRLATPLPLGGDGGRAPAVTLVARSCGRDEIVARLVARDFDTTWTGVFAAAAGRAAADDDAALTR